MYKIVILEYERDATSGQESNPAPLYEQNVAALDLLKVMAAVNSKPRKSRAKIKQEAAS